jgi:uncharacterized protein YqjF (DUF2071 family)
MLAYLAVSELTANGHSPTLDGRVALTRRPRDRRPVMYQRWEQLLFLHWTVAPEAIQATLPPGLTVDTYNGRAWLGVVPFFMKGLRPCYCPAVPGLSNFLELNLRTYVYDQHGRPGVWFYSLDANQRIAVKIAQTVFSLPYVYARIEARLASDGWLTFQSKRPGKDLQSFRYREGALLTQATPGSLEFFLVERYLLFSYSRKGQLFAGQVHHAPYPLREVEVNAHSRDLFRLNGFDDPERPFEHALMAPGVAVSVYGLEPVAAANLE